MPPSSDILFDLHVHSYYSSDCKSNPKDLIKVAEKKKLTGIAITDHNTTKFHKKEQIKSKLVIIPGVEISTKKGHIIGLGIIEEIPKRLTVVETIEKIEELGGLPVISHPFDFTRKGIGREVYKLSNVAIESQNASCPFQSFNEKAKQWALKNNLPETGGSDAHRIKDVGMAYTIVEELIETADELLELIRKRKTTSGGNHLSIPEKIVRSFQIHF
jgi:predicted metal-dependent phosphoesterase TrpH